MDNKVESVLQGALGGMKNLVDTDTVIGDPIRVSPEITLIPISKITCGFASGGSGFGGNPQNEHFGGGAGGCVKVTPVCFLVVKGDNVRMMPVLESETGLDKLMDLIPEMVDKVNDMIQSYRSEKKEIL